MVSTISKKSNSTTTANAAGKNAVLQKTIKKNAVDKSNGKSKEEVVNKYAKIKKWIDSIHREAEEDYDDDTVDSDIGAVHFTSDMQSYAIPFTGLHRLIKEKEVHSTDNLSDLKVSVEGVNGSIKKMPDNLEVFAAFLREGAKLMRNAGLDKVGEASEERMLEDEDGGDGEGDDADDSDEEKDEGDEEDEGADE
jgi:hypothetical protein